MQFLSFPPLISHHLIVLFEKIQFSHKTIATENPRAPIKPRPFTAASGKAPEDAVVEDEEDEEVVEEAVVLPLLVVLVVLVDAAFVVKVESVTLLFEFDTEET